MTERFICKKYGCEMRTASCTLRQQNGEPACKNCEQGREYFSVRADTYMEKRAKRAAIPKVPCENKPNGCENLCYGGLCNTCKSRIRQRKASGWDDSELSLPKVKRGGRRDRPLRQCAWPHGCDKFQQGKYCQRHWQVIYQRKCKWHESRWFEPVGANMGGGERVVERFPCKIPGCPNTITSQAKSGVCKTHIQTVKNRIERGTDPYREITPNDGSRRKRS